jgi:plasmid stability protein
MIKVSAGNGESSEAVLREHLDAMVQTNKGRPIRAVAIKQSFER